MSIGPAIQQFPEAGQGSFFGPQIRPFPFAAAPPQPTGPGKGGFGKTAAIYNLRAVGNDVQGTIASSSSHTTGVSVASLSANFGTSVKKPDSASNLHRSERSIIVRLEDQVQEALAEKQAADQSKENLRINAMRCIQEIENSVERQHRNITPEEVVFQSNFNTVVRTEMHIREAATGQEASDRAAFEHAVNQCEMRAYQTEEAKDANHRLALMESRGADAHFLEHCEENVLQHRAQHAAHVLLLEERMAQSAEHHEQ